MPPKSNSAPFGDLDIPHIGRLYRQVRLGRGDIRQKDVAIEAGAAPSTLNRFETTGNDKAPNNGGPLTRRSGYFEEYVRVLRQERINGRVVADPLKEEDAKMLLGVYAQNNTPSKVLKLQHDLAAVELDLLPRARANNHLQPLWELDQRLRAIGRPAFIADALWFIHAVNGPLLNLFGLHPHYHQSYFGRWEAWHVMGTKFVAHSPIREMHCSYNDYFPPTVDQFYRLLAPFMFTCQARALIHRLIQMSNANGFNFATWWHNAVAFRNSFEPEKLRRRLWYQNPAPAGGQRVVLRVATDMAAQCETPLCADGSYVASFWIGAWHGDDEDPAAQAILEDLDTPIEKDAVFYAADYDMQQSFHANTWPEVGPLLAP